MAVPNNVLKAIPFGSSLKQSVGETVYHARCRRIIPKLYPIDSGIELIRFGPEGDGGYLIPDDLKGIAACYSPGVSLVSGFEKECAERGMKVFLADASVECPADEHPLFDFKKMFLGGKPSTGFMTLEQWVADTSGYANDDLMLQMDIEGYEYEVLNSTPTELLKRFRIMVIEFHGLDRMTTDKARVLKRLVQTHECVHITRIIWATVST